MKLKLSSTDFEKGEITFRVPWDIFQTLEFWPTELEVDIEPLRRAKQPTTSASTPLSGDKVCDRDCKTFTTCPVAHHGYGCALE